MTNSEVWRKVVSPTVQSLEHPPNRNRLSSWDMFRTHPQSDPALRGRYWLENSSRWLSGDMEKK